MRWVILLLAIAVILPTVCLLWFMVQAVRNERLAVRQKLINLCVDRIDGAKNDFDTECERRRDKDFPVVCYIEHDNPAWIDAVTDGADGFVVYDFNGVLIYPVVDYRLEQESFEEVQDAFAMEVRGDFSGALEKYKQIAESNKVSSLFAASMGMIRCLDKLNREEELLNLFDKILYQDPPLRKRFTAKQVAMIKVRHIEWLANNDTYDHPDMYHDLMDWFAGEEIYSAETTIWALNKIIDIAIEQGEQERLRKSIDYARGVIKGETISLAASEYFNDQKNLESLPKEIWKSFKADRILYAFRYFVNDKDVLIIRTKESMLYRIEPVLDKIAIEGIGMRLTDERGDILFGPVKLDIQPFIITKLSDYLPDWSLQLYFEDGEIFDRAASKQAVLYTWSGLLVTLLIAICGAVAAQSISRQIKLNRLKNDFIATVTHELKTPLSSMRVLVDTLLDGNYEGQRTATEYLQLISRENERLSHLIDNFLTFSRMERNKQAFEIAQVSPVEIANSAADAVRTKFDKNGVDFGLDVAKPLPMIKADKDAMVTVLVNLLDNAYKYSNDDKRIELKVFREDGCVCFAVKDNGIGMTRRQVRKVFDRFYQADSSLTRRVEGAGLGLAIVKFIVYAHNGQITVASKPEKGSTFTVKLKALAGNGNDINNRR